MIIDIPMHIYVHNYMHTYLYLMGFLELCSCSGRGLQPDYTFISLLMRTTYIYICMSLVIYILAE